MTNNYPSSDSRGAGGTPAPRDAGVSPARPAGILLPAPGEDGLSSHNEQANGTHNAGETPASRCTPAPRRVVWRHILLLSVVSLSLFLVNGHVLPLADPEESRCALIVRDMTDRGHWRVANLDGEPYLDKPATFFWLAAGARRLTGDDEFAGRLVAGLSGWLAVLATYGLASRVFRNPLAGLLAGLMLATCGEFLFLARWYRMDLPFTAAMLGALWWFWRGEDRGAGVSPARPAGILPARGGEAGLTPYNDQPNGTHNAGETPAPRRGRDARVTWLGFYAFAAVATALKGPAGLVLPAMVVFAHLLLTRQARRVVEFFSPLGLLVFVLLASGPFVAAASASPDFLGEFFSRQNISRFTGSGNLGHNWPGVLYVPLVLGAMLPWTVYVPGAFARLFPFWPGRWRNREQHGGLVFLWTATLLPLIFFSFSGTKLVGYVLPVFPPLAALLGGLVAGWVVKPKHGHDKLLQTGAWALLITMAILLPALTITAEMVLRPGFPLGGSLPVGMILLCVICAAVALQIGNRVWFIGGAMTGVVAVWLYMILVVAPVGYERISARSLAAALPPGTTPDQLCTWAGEKFSFIYYANAETVQRYRRTKDDSDLARLVERFQGPEPVYCLVTKREHLDTLQTAAHGHAHVIAQTGNSWLLSNKPNKK